MLLKITKTTKKELFFKVESKNFNSMVEYLINNRKSDKPVDFDKFALTIAKKMLNFAITQNTTTTINFLHDCIRSTIIYNNLSEDDLTILFNAFLTFDSGYLTIDNTKYLLVNHKYIVSNDSASAEINFYGNMKQFKQDIKNVLNLNKKQNPLDYIKHNSAKFITK